MEERKQNATRSNNKDQKLKTLTNLRNNFARKLKKRLEYESKDKLTELQRKKVGEKPMLEQMISYFNGLLQKHKQVQDKKQENELPELSSDSKRILAVWNLKEKFDALTITSYLSEFPNKSGLHGFFTLVKSQNETEFAKLLSLSEERIPRSDSTYKEVNDFINRATDWFNRSSPSKSYSSPIAIVTPEEYQSLLQQSKFTPPPFDALSPSIPPGFSPPIVPELPPPGFTKPLEEKKEEVKSKKPEPEKLPPKIVAEISPPQDPKDFVPIIGRKKKKGKDDSNSKGKGNSKKGKGKYDESVPGI